MDYLDPKKKKAKRKKLLIMYALLGVAIAIATIVLVYLSNGYYVDKNTGAVIQNGLIYIDTKPESAEIYLNGQKQKGKTDARLVVPEGSYEIELKRQGYRSWIRSLTLEGGSLRRLTYARLVPEELQSESVVDLPSTPSMSTQSNDKRWLVLGYAKTPLEMQVFDLEADVVQPKKLGLPVSIIDTTKPGTWHPIEWADDHKTFLAEYRMKNSSVYALINRDRPELSVSVNEVFKTTSFSSVAMRDRKSDKVYLFDSKTGVLLRGDIKAKTAVVALTDVVDYSAHDEAVVYVSAKDAQKNYVSAKLFVDEKTYKLREIKKDVSYLLDISKIGNAFVLGVGSAAENRVIVYNDPIKAIEENTTSSLPVATTVLRVPSPSELRISADSSTIIARSGQNVASHEFEADRSYTFTLSATVDKNTELRWLDGQHFLYSSKGLQYMSDYDGSNQYKLVTSNPALGSYFEKETDEQFTFGDANTAKKQPARLIRTYFRILEDR